MIRIVVALALLGAVVGAAQASPGMRLSVSASVSNEFLPKRAVVVKVRTVAGASCSLSDALTGVQLHATTKTGQLTWRWRPSIWANGSDDAAVRCAKGSAHRSTSVPLLYLLLQQIHVLRHYAVHLVYWAPDGDMPVDVAPTALQLETDVKAALDAGATDNPFAIPRGFGDSLGGGDPRIASIDSTDVADAYPTKPAAGYCQGAAPPCLGRPDLDNEVTRLAREHGWAAGNRSLIMVFTAPSVTACFTTGACTAQTEACGYHWLAPAGFAYADVIMSGLGSGCGGTAAGYTVALIGHEQNEAVVDPEGFGVEVGDPCEGDVESISINGHSYNLPAIEQPNTKCSFAYTP